MELNENEIIVQMAAGNWVNFDRIYDHYLPKIYQFIYYRIRHKQTAEDITSQVFMKVVQNISSYKAGQAPFGAWIYRIARNALIDHVRTSKPTLELETALGVASKDDVAAKTELRLRLESIKTAMLSLSELQRDVLTMRVWDGLSHKEISEILQISEDSSKVAFSRATANLKQRMEIYAG